MDSLIGCWPGEQGPTLSWIMNSDQTGQSTLTWIVTR